MARPGLTQERTDVLALDDEVLREVDEEMFPGLHASCDELLEVLVGPRLRLRVQEDVLDGEGLHQLRHLLGDDLEGGMLDLRVPDGHELPVDHRDSVADCPDELAAA